MNRILILVLVLGGLSGYTQNNAPSTYIDSINAFRADYIQTHELLTTKEQKALLRFYPLNPSYRVVARFERYADSPWFPMATSGAGHQMHRKYGRLTFNKAYNPYCAYTAGYNCPIPPPENNLPVAIHAGEMNYGKGH